MIDILELDRVLDLVPERLVFGGDRYSFQAFSWDRLWLHVEVRPLNLVLELDLVL